MRDLRSPFARDFTRADANELAGVFKALAHPTRLQMLALVATRPGLNSAQAEALLDGPSQPTVTHHMRVLVKSGVLRRGERGASVPHRVDADAMAGLADALRSGGKR